MAVVATVAVVAGAMAALPATAEEESPSAATRHARDLPGLASSPAPPVVPEAPVGDFRNRPSMDGQPDRPAPSSFDPQRSVPVAAETTPTRRVFANPDGSRTLEQATRPVRYRLTPEGPWIDIDLSLVPAADGTLAARAAPASPRLAPTAGGALASVDTSA
ncbi:MAG TPA: hypothetical protein VFO65_01190, partial [Acidimicrobiales bacterium]|nr:hypothetical protein [Acidimicrobiales bacterium]